MGHHLRNFLILLLFWYQCPDKISWVPNKAEWLVTWGNLSWFFMWHLKRFLTFSQCVPTCPFFLHMPNYKSRKSNDPNEQNNSKHKVGMPNRWKDSWNNLLLGLVLLEKLVVVCLTTKQQQKRHWKSQFAVFVVLHFLFACFACFLP